MDLCSLDAIDDPQALRELACGLLAERDAALQVAQQQARTAQERERTITRRDAQVAALTTEIARLRRLQFSARTERMDPAQRELFQETMAADIAAVQAQLQAIQAEGDDAPSTVQQRRKAASTWRKPLPEHLERVEIRHEPGTCTCPQCQGALVHIGDHASERLACKPLQFYVKRDVYPQYACRACEQVVAEPVAAAIIERGQADSSLLAQLVIAKYVDHLPLYRQEAIYARSGLDLSRSTLAEWTGAVGVALQPLARRLGEQLRQQPVLHADETPIALLDPKAGKTRRTYLFAYTNAQHVGADPPQVVFQFQFQISRSGQHARDFLGNWRGVLMVDDYAGYKASFAQGVSELACWAHARRKWHEQHLASGSQIAQQALARIEVLYRIEEAARSMDAEQRHAWRQAHAVPALAKLKTWLDELQPKVLGNSGTARALAYTLRRWEALTRYAIDGRHPIDNNPIENAIRPIALGRKNWLFAGSEQAGRRAAAIMSLLATAKANGLDPYAWLTDTLARLPTTLDRDIDTLLPLRCH
ncbi:transposase [Xanthomonas campestris]|uniref:IS66 family transposase n=1 Tax=Xanthomonas campestris TaxID=339 RepID=UPI002DFC318B|nr:IS66 family transposase [Xanthomonas campestris]MEC5196784.1 transposase [Xanthomonas campestris]